MKRKVTAGIAIFIFLLIQLFYYNPFTPIGAIRWAVLWEGFVVESYKIQVEFIPREEIGVGTLSPSDFTKDQTIYHVTSPNLIEAITGTEKTYYVVTDLKNGLYVARFTGY